MTENDAKVFGHTVVYKPMKFLRKYVTCTNCKANYDQNHEPRFCQPFTMPINPSATEENMDRAAQCGQWCAKGMDRNMVVTPDYKTWYED